MVRARWPEARGCACLVTICWLVAACGRAGSSAAVAVAVSDDHPPVPPPSDAWTGVVTDVVDGDTLWVEVIEADGVDPAVGVDIKLRLLRIDAPERAQGQAPTDCLADAATRHLAGLAPEGSRVRAAHDVERQDRFGRELVHLWTTDGAWVNGRMVLDGYADVATFPPNVAHDAQIRARLADARDARRGLWDRSRCG